MLPFWIQRLVIATGTTNVHVLKPSYVAAFISEDPDRYIHNMTTMDLIARGTPNQQAYIEASAQAALNTHVTIKEKRYLYQAAKAADVYFRDNVTEIDGKAVANIPWKIAFIQGKTYEGGLPHTRTDIIFMSPAILRYSRQEFVETLIHEKIHVYQRANPRKMKEWIAKNKYMPTGKVADRPKNSNIRSNPDIGEWYFDMGPSRYTSSRPKSITDAKNGGASEHPYEKMAYEIAGKYKFQ